MTNAAVTAPNAPTLDWTSAKDRKAAFRAVARQNVPRISLHGCQNVNALRLRELGTLARAATQAKIRPELVDVSDMVLSSLTLTRLDTAFVCVRIPPAPIGIAEKTWATPQTRVMTRLMACASIIIVAFTLSGCVSNERLNHVDRPIEKKGSRAGLPVPARFANQCTDDEASPGAAIVPVAMSSQLLESATPRHGPGDVLRVDVAEGAEFSGSYAVDMDGSLSLPYAGNVQARGRTTGEIKRAIHEKLISGGFFQDGQLQVSVLPLRYAPAQILVSGAVYQPGRALINEVPAEKRDGDALATIGDAPIARNLDAGIRGGAGIRPDADIRNIVLRRGGKAHKIDLSGVMTGQPVPDIPLMTGDSIEIPSSGCFHRSLLRPSQLTPAGIRVFMSNLTQPATSNTASAIERYATSLPYGTRLLQAAVSSNCMGGAEASNAHRSVVLISNNPLTGQPEVIERSIEFLVDNAEREDVNPYLLPNDAMACYDSGVTNVREVAKTMSEVFGPLGFVLGLL
jgi:polysaccharide biosynthesis/export protein